MVAWLRWLPIPAKSCGIRSCRRRPENRTSTDLSDIDGQISIVGQDIYAVGYQGRLASVAAESGQILWSRDRFLLCRCFG